MCVFRKIQPTLLSAYLPPPPKKKTPDDTTDMGDGGNFLENDTPELRGLGSLLSMLESIHSSRHAG